MSHVKRNQSSRSGLVRTRVRPVTTGERGGPWSGMVGSWVMFICPVISACSSRLRGCSSSLPFLIPLAGWTSSRGPKGKRIPADRLRQRRFQPGHVCKVVGEGSAGARDGDWSSARTRGGKRNEPRDRSGRITYIVNEAVPGGRREHTRPE